MPRKNLYPSSKPPHADNVSLNLDQVGAQYGLWLVISPARLYTRKWSGLYIHVQCTGCGQEAWVAQANLASGRSTGCNDCGHERQVPRWLWQRFAQAKSRCTNPNDPGWKAYGGRGIEFRFASPTEAALYMIEKYGAPDRGLELDRRNNDRHYERGNLRWVTGRQNRRNTQRCKYPPWDPKVWPYCKNQVYWRLRNGMTRQQIIADAYKAVAEKRKNWRAIHEKLASLTS